MIAIVTGATRGIGKEIAITLAKNGYNVVINYNNNKDKALEVKALCDEYNEALIVKGNVAIYDEAKAIIDAAVEKFGHIDVVVNNAGITKDNLLLRMSEDDFDDVINVNLKGTFNMCKHAAKVMLKQRSGHIINMASVVGEIGNIGQCNYSASKGGVISFTKSLARELASRGITVNAIAPGFIKTDMTDKMTDEAKEAVSKQIPLGRMGETKDIANAALFLASDSSSYITGQVINVCGGMVM